MEENTKQPDNKNNSCANASSVDAGVLSEQTLIELGFEKEPDGMYYERGWMNFTVNIHFGERKITKKTFWEHVLRTVEVRGEINFKNRLKELLK